MKLPGCLVEAHVRLAVLISCLSVVETLLLPGCLRLEGESRREHLLHQQARRDGHERVVHGLVHRLLRGVRLGNQIGELGAGLSRRITRRAADDLDDLCQRGSIADGQRVLAPDPVEALLRHAKGDDDVHVVAVVGMGRVLERPDDAVSEGSVIIHKIRDL